MRKRVPSSGTASVFTFAISQCPASSLATFSSSGVITRHGPHHGAQKSTTTGSDVDEISASNVRASGTSTGSGGSERAAWHEPHRFGAASVG